MHKTQQLPSTINESHRLDDSIRTETVNTLKRLGLELKPVTGRTPFSPNGLAIAQTTERVPDELFLKIHKQFESQGWTVIYHTDMQSYDVEHIKLGNTFRVDIAGPRKGLLTIWVPNYYQ